MSRALKIINIGGVNDNRFVLGNAMIARKLDLTPHFAEPHLWPRLRIGFRLSFDDFGSDVLDNPKLWIGVMNDPAVGMPNGPLTNSSNHCVGGVTVDATWTRAAGPPARYAIQSAGAVWQLRKRVGSTDTNGTGNSSNTPVPADPSSRVVFLGEFTRSGGNLVFDLYGNTSQSFPNKSESLLITAMGRSTLALAASTIGDMGIKHLGQVVAIDEVTNGNLNSIFFAWDQISPKAYFSECFYSVFAS